MCSVRDKLTAWVESNPQGYYSKTLAEIASEAGVSPASVSNVLPEVMARFEGVLPSMVIAKRREAGFTRIGREGLSLNQQRQISTLHRRCTEVVDIAYLVGVSPRRVRKFIAEVMDA